MKTKEEKAQGGSEQCRELDRQHCSFLASENCGASLQCCRTGFQNWDVKAQQLRTVLCFSCLRFLFFNIFYHNHYDAFSNRKTNPLKMGGNHMVSTRRVATADFWQTFRDSIHLPALKAGLQQALRSALLGNSSLVKQCWKEQIFTLVSKKLWREEKLSAGLDLQSKRRGTELPWAGLPSPWCTGVLCNAQGCCPCFQQNLSSECIFSTLLNVFQTRQWWLLATGWFFTVGI